MPRQGSNRTDDRVVFQGAHQLENADLERHQLEDLGSRRFGRKLEDLKVEWASAARQIEAMIRAAETSSGTDPSTNFSVDEVTVSLGFNARGHLVFVAEAGVEPSVQITFKRRANR